MTTDERLSKVIEQQGVSMRNMSEELHTLRAENERLAAACREFERQRDEARAKVSELAVNLNEARRDD